MFSKLFKRCTHEPIENLQRTIDHQQELIEYQRKEIEDASAHYHKLKEAFRHQQKIIRELRDELNDTKIHVKERPSRKKKDI